jgi:hypothetical protein
MRRRGGMKKAGKIALTAQRITRAASPSAGWWKMMRGPSQRIGRGKARPHAEGSRPMCDAVEFARLGAAGKEVREVLARHGLNVDQGQRVLAALMAQNTLADRRQCEWPQAARATVDLVGGYILAARARRMAALAAAPPRGTA